MVRRPASTDSPVSSVTSRTAAVSRSSPGSSLPLGSDQSSYFGRCTTAVSMPPSPAGRHSAPPAAAMTSSAGLLTGPFHQLALVVALAAERPGPVAVEMPAPDVGGHRGVEDALQLG